MARPARNRHQRRRDQRLDRRRNGPLSQTLHALWGSAFALSSLPQAARADTPVDRYTAEYSFSSYTEDEIDSSKVFVGETERYEIEMHQFTVRAPLTSSSDLSIELVHETMSGASPWYTIPDIPGPGSEPLQFMTGATIEDTRDDVLVQYNRYSDTGRLGFAAGYSSENDYSAINLGINGDTSFNEGNTTLSLGLDVSLDEIEPTDAELFSTRPTSEEKKTYTLMLGLSQLLNRASLIQSNVTYKFSDGYLSDPYKAVWHQDGGVIVAENRPDSRHQLAWTTSVRGHVRELDGTLQGEYRLHLDTWGVTSHTVALAWHQQLGRRLAIIPSFRYYSQSEADFYRPYFDLGESVSKERSSDYRLSAYGSMLFGVKAQYRFRTPWTGKHDFMLTAAWDNYFSSEDLSFDDDARESPGLVDYDVVTIGLTFLW